MPLIITKNGSRNFSHFDGFKSLNASLSYGMILDETDNTAIVTLPNGSVFPHTPVNSSDITVIDGATTNTYATVELLRARLVALGYPPFVEAGGGGGAVDSVNSQTGVVVLNASDVGAPSGSGTSSGTNTGDQNLSGLMVKSNNLSDVTNVATARTNLGVVAISTWTDYLATSTIVGLPSATGHFHVNHIEEDKILFVNLSLSATSTATTISVTIPHNAKTTNFYSVYVNNNGTRAFGRAATVAGSNVITFAISASGASWNAASGTKEIQLIIPIEVE